MKNLKVFADFDGNIKVAEQGDLFKDDKAELVLSGRGVKFVPFPEFENAVKAMDVFIPNGIVRIK